MAALLGRSLNDLEMYSIADLSPGQTMAGIADLVAIRVLRDDGQRIEFVNELMRAQAYLLIPSPLRKLVHKRVADVLVARHHAGQRVNAFEIAWHCMRANLPAEATAFLLRGCREALLGGALQEAERSLTTGLTSISEPQRAEAVFLLVDVLQEQARWGESLSVLQTLPPDLRQQDQDLQRILAIDCLYRMPSIQSFVNEDRFAELLSIARRTTDDQVLARALCVAANLACDLGVSETARAMLEVAKKLDVGRLPELEQVRLRLAIAQMHFYTGDNHSAHEWINDCLMLARAEGRASALVARLLVGLGVLAISTGDYSAARESLREAYSIATGMSNEDLAGQAMGNLSLCTMRLGEYGGAIEFAEQSMKHMAGLEASAYSSSVIAYLLSSAMLGREDAVQAAVAKDRFGMGSSGRAVKRLRWQLLSADALAMLGRAKDAMTVGRLGTWANGLGVPDRRCVGPYARWAAASARDRAELASISRLVRETLLPSVDTYDMIDRADVLLTVGRLHPADLTIRTKLGPVLSALPAAVARQLERMGFSA
jgi:tetratricopeptide (TPR) repeat protein